MSNTPFAAEQAAMRYAAGRPFVHPLFMPCLQAALPSRRRGADVGCGTGLSSLALAEVVDEVLAYDQAAAMLRCAAAHPRVQYAQADACKLPLPDHSLDVLSAAQVLYKLPQQAFLEEARRLLRPGGLVYAYDVYLVGPLVTAHTSPLRSDFDRVMQAFWQRYPVAFQQREVFGPQEAAEAGFVYLKQQVTVPWTFSLAQLRAYLLTLPGPSAALARAATRHSAGSAAEITAWLTAQLSPLFASQPQCQLLLSAQTVMLWPLATGQDQ